MMILMGCYMQCGSHSGVWREVTAIEEGRPPEAGDAHIHTSAALGAGPVPSLRWAAGQSHFGLTLSWS